MSRMYFSWRIMTVNYSKRTFFTPAKTVHGAVTADVNKEKLPMYRKWISYWKALLRDYRDVINDVGQQMKVHPVKSGIWCSIIGCTITCCVLNPDETQYRESLIKRANELIFIGKPIRNPEADEYLKNIEWYYNQDLIKRFSFGIFSIFFLNYKNNDSGLYKDNCSYTQPTYFEILQNNIIDIGFWNKFWILEKKMINYDINPNEWNSA